MQTHNLSRTLIALSMLAMVVLGCSRLSQNQSNTAQQPDKPVANSTNSSSTPEKSSGVFVRDEANVIESKPEAEIETALRQLEERAKVKFIVMTVKTAGGVDLKDYAADRLSKMDVSAEKGVILLVAALEDREWFIKPAPGLDVELTQGDYQEIGDKLTLDFKAERYADGVKKCVREMIAKLEKTEKFEPIELK